MAPAAGPTRGGADVKFCSPEARQAVVTVSNKVALTHWKTVKSRTPAINWESRLSVASSQLPSPDLRTQMEHPQRRQGAWSWRGGTYSLTTNLTAGSCLACGETGQTSDFRWRFDAACLAAWPSCGRSPLPCCDLCASPPVSQALWKPGEDPGGSAAPCSRRPSACGGPVPGSRACTSSPLSSRGRARGQSAPQLLGAEAAGTPEDCAC